MSIVIKFNDYSNSVKTIGVDYDPCNFEETTFNYDGKDIDLTGNGICYSKTIIKKFFGIMTKFPKMSEPIHDIKKIEESLGDNPVFANKGSILSDSSISIDFGLGHDVTFDDLLELYLLSQHFGFERLKEDIETLFTNLQQFINDICVHYKKNPEGMSINEYYVICFNKDYTIDKKFKHIKLDFLETDIHLYRKKYILEFFIRNIYNFYTFYKQYSDIDIFFKVIKTVNEHIEVINHAYGNYFKYFQNISANIDKINLNSSDLTGLSLDTLFNLFTNIPNVMKSNNNVFKLYDYYDVLNYEKAQMTTFECGIQTCQEYGKKCLVPYDVFVRLFHELTNGIFKDFDWTNVVLTGGFLYGLVNNLDEAILPGSDIDLFVYGSDGIIEKKTRELVNYFSSYKPYYVTNGSVITVIIPALKHDIQIIFFDYKDPIDIIQHFDYNYVKLYYDGVNVISTFDNIIAIKYKVAIIDSCKIAAQKEGNTISRLYKTIIKGFNIKYDESFKCKYIKANEIMLSDMSQDNTIKMSLNKSVTVRKLLCHLEPDEIVPLIQSYYKSLKVSIDVPIVAVLSNDTDSDYGFLKVTNNKVDIGQIVKMNCGDEHHNISWFTFQLSDDTIVKNITLETNYCNFNWGIINSKHKLRLYNLDDTTKSKLKMLHNTIVDILKSKYNRIRTITIGSSDDFKKVDSMKTSLTVHFSGQLKHQKMIATLSELNQNSDTVKVTCSGHFWVSNGQTCGIKFIVDKIQSNRKYNIL